MDLFEDKIFNNNPLYMKSLIGQTVEITTTDSQSIKGVVYVIDPIYKTIVLHTRESSPKKHDTVFILYHAIKSLELQAGERDKTYLERQAPIDENVNSSAEKRRLKKWLQQMYINVEEAGEYLKIDDHLLILPPYGLNNCICSNVIVLEKIRNIINLMPTDFV
ncbi:gem-associated protein 6 [Dendroctonus ponderosae]